MTRKKRKPWLHNATKRNMAIGELSVSILRMIAHSQENKNSATEKTKGYGCFFILFDLKGIIHY